MKTQSSFFDLNKKDLIKALVITIVSVVLGSITDIFKQGSVPTVDQLVDIGILALKVGGAYIVKNLLTNSNDQFLSKEK